MDPRRAMTLYIALQKMVAGDDVDDDERDIALAHLIAEHLVLQEDGGYTFLGHVMGVARDLREQITAQMKAEAEHGRAH